MNPWIKVTEAVNQALICEKYRMRARSVDTVLRVRLGIQSRYHPVKMYSFEGSYERNNGIPN
jgi:hypothetical protein